MIEKLKNKKSLKIISLIIFLNLASLCVMVFGSKGNYIYDTTINLIVFITSTTFILSPLLIFLPNES